ncbi:phage holin family protein [Luteococcus sp. Sow4_B9]|uniref:phage holin family protein n=1 Tax=Luteococcus sp. Sow4_B9 TaxID=3438792 RepID=UPI003F9A9497
MTGAHVPPTGPGDDRSIGEIVADLSENFSTLLRQELDLAKAELKQDATKAGTGAGLLTGAGITAHLALTFLSLALWWTIAIWIGSHDHPALGWSGLILAVLWGIVAAVMAGNGRKRMQQIDGLPRTTETTKKIPDALKGHEEKNR